MKVVAESPGDRAAIRQVNLAAFPTAAEANLVDALRARAAPLVSLVAVDEAVIVGHILFSPVGIDGHDALRIGGLAPMAVTPDRQRRGVGSALVRAGLEHSEQRGFGAVVVLGHPSFYSRFGFQPATRWGLTCEYDAPPGAFMALELQDGYLRDVHGLIRYHPAFNDLPEP